MTYNKQIGDDIRKMLEEHCQLLITRMMDDRRVSEAEYCILGSPDVTCLLPQRVKFFINVGLGYRIYVDADISTVLNHPETVVARFDQELKKYEREVLHDVQ